MVASPAPSRIRFGAYDIERKLGHGMTDVYLAFDSAHGRPAVLKLIRHSFDAPTRQVIEAERRGASIQQQVHAFDERVIAIYDYGDLEGCFFVALEYVEGENVAQMLRRERQIQPLRAARIALEVASQLEALHSFSAQIDGRAAAVVHGDIKPSNIQVAADGRIRLLDFGISKSVTLLHNLTVHEFGSPNYCSPERLDRAQVDTDADLWALGVTLYEMVAGSPPYQAESTRKLEDLIQSKRPPRALPNGCPRSLKAIIGKALAADPAQRYGTAAIFREDLAAFLENRPTVAERERRRPWRVNPTVDSRKSKPEQAPGWQLDVPWKRVAAAMGCVTLGMAVFLATGYYWRFHNESRRFLRNLDLTQASASTIDARWNDLERLRSEYAFLGKHSPVGTLAQALRAAYVGSADRVIDAWHSSNEPNIETFDWRKAEACLKRAVALDVADSFTRGKLAFVRGTLDWIDALHSAGDPPRLAQLRNSALARFQAATTDIPVSPDPHLGIAALRAYSFRDTDGAIFELAMAQALGYKLQSREIEIKADAYRLRAWQELGEAWSPKIARADVTRLVVLGQRDLEAAQGLYEQIRGFDRVDEHLRQVKAVYGKTLAAPAVALKAGGGKSKSRSRRWR